MPGITTALFDLRMLDTLSCRDSVVHRLDPRAKIFASAVFIVIVMSFGRCTIAALAPFFLFPAVMIALGRIPMADLAAKLALASPFAILVGAFNPLIDTTAIELGSGLSVSAGWLSFGSILLRFVLTVSAALAVVYTTGMYRLCLGLRQLGVPNVLAVQLLFLYRYLFVLGEETGRMVRAVGLRSRPSRRINMHVFAKMAGMLFVRTLSRAERIHRAMVCRGFRGEIRMAGTVKFGMRDAVFTTAWTAYCVVLRFFDITEIIGRSFAGFFS